ncbi:MAG: hypothetical protein WDM85_09995 [Caulobacteraceae bacterium]
MRLAIVSLMALAAGANAFAQTPAATPATEAAPRAGRDARAAPTGRANAASHRAARRDHAGGRDAAASVTSAAPTPASPAADRSDSDRGVGRAAEGLHSGRQRWQLRPDRQRLRPEEAGRLQLGGKAEGLHPDGGGSRLQSDPVPRRPGAPRPMSRRPARPIIIALNDWAAVERGWSLYRNDKNVQGTTQFTTRSWQLDWNGQEQSLVFTTMRKPDGTPAKGAQDTSQLIYGVLKLPS